VSRRAASGESSIYRDEDGRWHGYVSMGKKENGRRDRRHVSGVKRADVVAKVRELERKRDAGTAGAAGKAPTVREWLEHWLDTIAARKVRPSTLVRYRQLTANQLVPGIGHHRLDRLQPEHVEKLYSDLQERGLSPASVLQAHRVLSRALKVAMQRDRVARNVCTLVDAPSVERDEVRPLSGHDARRVLEAARGRRNAARWSVALALGLRQGEALGLTWDAVDLDAGTLTVRQALQRQPGKGLVLVQPKSRAGRRTVALPGPLRDALRAHRAAQAAERIAAGSVWEDNNLVFCQENGRPLEPRSDHRTWRALLAEAKVRSARLHDARHTAASLLLQQGVPARVVMEILGHSQISLTLGTYSHVVPELAEDAARRMGEALWG
jgi:integrase